MPVRKYSAMDPDGTWKMDAMDQVNMWNADRGDRLSQYSQSRMDQRSQDDWRKEVALKQLGLQGEMYRGGREESALERQARADAEKAKYGYMGGRDAAADEQWNRRFALDERGANLQLSEAERMAKERADEAASLDAFDPSSFGLSKDAWAAAPRGIKSQVAANLMSRGIMKAQRPEDLAMRREDANINAAEEARAALEAGNFTGEKQAMRYRQMAKRGGVSDVVEGRGQTVPAQSVFAQPEVSQIVEGLRNQLRSVPEEYTNTSAGEAVGEVVKNTIQAQATELAKQFGTDPEQLARLMYAAVVQGEPGQAKGFLGSLGRGVAELGTLGLARTKNEAAQDILRERFAQ